MLMRGIVLEIGFWFQWVRELQRSRGQVVAFNLHDKKASMVNKPSRVFDPG